MPGLSRFPLQILRLLPGLWTESAQPFHQVLCSSSLILTQSDLIPSHSISHHYHGADSQIASFTQTPLLCYVHLRASWTPAPGFPRAPSTQHKNKSSFSSPYSALPLKKTTKNLPVFLLNFSSLPTQFPKKENWKSSRDFCKDLSSGWARWTLKGHAPYWRPRPTKTSLKPTALVGSPGWG